MKGLFLLFFSVWISAFLLGCINIPQTSYVNVGSGYCEKWSVDVPGIDGGSQRELRFTDSNGHNILVWKKLTGEIITHEGMAVFVGGISYGKAMGITYFAVKGSGPVVAIAQTILVQEARRNGESEQGYLERYHEWTLTSTNNLVCLRYVTRGNAPDHFVCMKWPEMSAMVDDVLKTGQRKKDSASGIVYLEQ